MFRFCRVFFAVALCCLMTGAFPAWAAADEPGALRKGWGKLWSQIQTLESNWKECCRNCTYSWYGKPTQPNYGLQILDDSKLSKTSDSLVIFVHGYNSRPEDLSVLIEQAQQAGHRCATFRYPNDQALADSAHLLSNVLTQQTTQISLVTHSMGGLIARETIENPQLDPGNVRQLIMIAPPNHGSQLARIACSMDVIEYVTCDHRREEAGFIYGSIIDGLAEATDDMTPNSAFLRQLNARARNAKVRYTIFLGSDAPLDQNTLKRTRQCLAHASARFSWIREMKAQLKSNLPEIDELVAGRGDGIVSVRRGRLEGVKDLFIGDFDHHSILSPTPTTEALKARDQIIAKLSE
ncbi:MAG: hypothetical protein GY768_03200 [Planctomycetaceae bacterium]|nr:hypothetical protein [Planctomycetaceae bacterium]